MGSFKQISIASLCLGAAVVFGNYVNREPTVPADLDSVAAEIPKPPNSSVRSRISTDELDLTESRAGAISTMRHRSKPNFLFPQNGPLPNSEEGSLLPPPSQLASDVTLPVVNVNPELADLPEVNGPDFSAIAAAFDSAPKDVSVLGTMPTLKRRPAEGLIQAGEPEIMSRRTENVSEQPIQTSDTYQVVEKPLGFTNQDFDARLRGESGMVEVASQRADSVTSMLPPPPSIESSSNSGGNRVRTMLPFRLTDGAKHELVELRTQATVKLTLDTTKFVDHVVQPGETLQSISTRYFGKPDYYLDIYLANRGKLRNPAVVPEGMLVKVPVYQK